jgi:protein O-mannosyl-transferase
VLGLVALNLFIYAPALHFGFLRYDDSQYVSANAVLSHGLTWSGLSWAFNIGYSANWHPLTWISHMLDVQLFGMVPERHHLVSILLHIANSLLLFWLLFRTTRAWRRSAVVAMLFAVHPLHVESVAWIAERKDVLSTLLWLLVFHAYVSYARRPALLKLVGVFAALALGLMAKPMLMTAPLLLLLFDIWPLGRLSLDAGDSRPFAKLLVEKIPLFALSALSGVVTVVAQSRGGAVQNLEVLPFGERVSNALASYLLYVAQMFWPRNLIAHYAYEPTAPWLAVVCGVVLLSISVLSIKVARRHPFLLAGWFWYVCALLPVIGLIQVGTQPRADRYTYVPLVGLFIVIAWGLPLVVAAGRRRDIALGAAAGVAIVTLAVAAREQVRYWENDLTLWRHAVQVSPRNYFARTNLGDALLLTGDLDAANDQFVEALRTESNSAATRNGLGTVLFRKGRREEARSQYAEALRLEPGFAEAHSNLGMVLGALGEHERAIPEFQTALQLDPLTPDVHLNLGFSLASLGRLGEAIAEYQAELTISPTSAETLAAFGDALFLEGDIPGAIAQYGQALAANPEDAHAHNNLGLALMNEKRLPEAVSHFKEALRLDPDSEEVRKNLDEALRYH